MEDELWRFFARHGRGADRRGGGRRDGEYAPQADENLRGPHDAVHDAGDGCSAGRSDAQHRLKRGSERSLFSRVRLKEKILGLCVGTDVLGRPSALGNIRPYGAVLGSPFGRAVSEAD